MAKQATKTKLTLKGIEKELERILKALHKQAAKKGLTPEQKKVLAKDIKNIQKLIKDIPPNCYLHTPPYDIGLS